MSLSSLSDERASTGVDEEERVCDTDESHHTKGRMGQNCEAVLQK